MKKLPPIQALRLITGMFNPKHAITILGLVNLLARKLDKDELLEDEFLIEQFKIIGIELILNEVEE